MILKKYYSTILFLAGFGIFIFTRLSKLVPTIPVSILISFIFILRFSRTQSAKKGSWLTFLGFILSMNIALWGLFDLGGGISSLLFNLIRSILLALLYFLPFMFDKLIYPKFEKKGFISTLVFPVITTACFFLMTREGPFEGAIQSSKFVFGPVQFMQLLSLFGAFGFVFVTAWFASVINYLWENNFTWEKSKKTALILLSVISFIFIFGTVKTSSVFIKKSKKVNIATVVLKPENGKVLSMDDIFQKKLTHHFNERILKIENTVKTAVAKNAKIVAFPEFTILIDEENRNRLITNLQRISRENNAYIAVNYAYLAKKGKGGNILLFINNQGKILLDYAKRYLLGIGNFGETAVFKKGAEIIQSVKTPYGKIGVAICRDMEMVKFIKQAGEQNVDIMVATAYEWPKRWTLNSPQRAIEFGFSLVRPTYNGISFAEDYNGNILNKMNFDSAEDRIMYADVPVKGIRTLYTKISDIIAWISVLGFIFIIIWVIKNKTKNKSDL